MDGVPRKGVRSTSFEVNLTPFSRNCETTGAGDAGTGVTSLETQRQANCRSLSPLSFVVLHIAESIALPMSSSPSPASVALDDLLQALDWVSDLSSTENMAFVCRESGRVFMTSDEDFGVELEPDLPLDINDETKYAIVPTRQDLRLGKRLAVRFVQVSLPARLEETYTIFAARGAYARFKDMLESEQALDAWYAFEAEAVERSLREWVELEMLVVAASDSKR